MSQSICNLRTAHNVKIQEIERKTVQPIAGSVGRSSVAPVKHVRVRLMSNTFKNESVYAITSDTQLSVLAKKVVKEYSWQSSTQRTWISA